MSWCLGIAQVNPSARGRARLYVHDGSGLEAWRRWSGRPGSGDRLRSLCSTGQRGRCPAGTQGARPKPRLQGKRHLPGVRQASKWPAIAPPCSCSDPEPRPSAQGAPRAAPLPPPPPPPPPPFTCARRPLSVRAGPVAAFQIPPSQSPPCTRSSGRKTKANTAQRCRRGGEGASWTRMRETES